jgi:hypothetical protein
LGIENAPIYDSKGKNLKKELNELLYVLNKYARGECYAHDA